MPFKCPKCIPMRYVFMVLNAIGMAIIYGLKVNLSVAIVAMVNHTALAAKHAHSNDSHGDGHGGGGDEVECEVAKANVTGNDTDSGGSFEGPFEWPEPTQGLILGAYFWGYIITQLPGGRLSEMFSGKHLFGFGVVLNIICTILSPICAKAHYAAFIAMRVGEGLGGGVTFPATHVLLSHWAPPAERSFMSSACYAGTALGTVISLPFSGILAGTLGWESVFYVQGGLCVLWYILWLLFVYDTPQTHPFISDEEKEFIVTSMGGSASDTAHHKAPPVPWKAVFTSLPFWAILIAHTCSNWGWYMLLVELPTFMKYILKFDIKENALLSAVPYLCMWIFGMVFGNRASWAIGKGMVSVTVVRKFATTLASVIPAICLVAVTFVGCDRTAAVVLLTVGVTGIAGMYSGFLTNHIDIASNYAGTLVAITNTVATIPGFVVPVFVGALTHGNQTVAIWRIIFVVTAVLYAVECVVYLIFGSGVEQAWNKLHEEKKPGRAEGEEGVPLNEINNKV